MKKILATLLLCVVIPVVQAGVATDRLNSFLNDVKTVQADFSQTVMDANQETLQESAGSMLIQRPSRFRWNYKKPYEQVIISDGQRVWLYDMDLEQVTVNEVDTALQNTPAILLSGNKPINENFNVTEIGSKDGLEWVEMYPKEAAGTFEKMLLGFSEDNLQIMQLIDSLGQTTTLIFNNIIKNHDIDADVFKFVPPEGVDVIGEIE
jgi:outer membrane lipoprotein carrier protein